MKTQSPWKKITESIDGFDEYDVKEYVDKFLAEHPDLPKLVAFKVVAAELSTDYDTDIKPGDVKLAFEGQPSVGGLPAPVDTEIAADKKYEPVFDDDYEIDVEPEELEEAVKVLKRAGYSLKD
jgi:hypothetical protein